VGDPLTRAGAEAAPGAEHPRGSSVAGQLARLGFTHVDRVEATMRRLDLLGRAGAPERLTVNVVRK